MKDNYFEKNFGKKATLIHSKQNPDMDKSLKKIVWYISKNYLTNNAYLYKYILKSVFYKNGLAKMVHTE